MRATRPPPFFIMKIFELVLTDGIKIKMEHINSFNAENGVLTFKYVNKKKLSNESMFVEEVELVVLETDVVSFTEVK